MQISVIPRRMWLNVKWTLQLSNAIIAYQL